MTAQKILIFTIGKEVFGVNIDEIISFLETEHEDDGYSKLLSILDFKKIVTGSSGKQEIKLVNINNILVGLNVDVIKGVVYMETIKEQIANNIDSIYSNLVIINLKKNKALNKFKQPEIIEALIKTPVASFLL